MIYLDNAATSWPKPQSVYDTIIDTMHNKGGNPGRSGHKMSTKAGEVVETTRFLLGKLFNIDDCNRIVFALNATDAINMAINGSLNEGDHVITSSMEHNSVARPLEHKKQQGVLVDKVAMDPVYGVSTQDIIDKIQDKTKLIAITHASNVTGTINPIEEIGLICKERNITFLVDASQSAGTTEIDVQKMNIDMLAFPGHKSLMGPMGTGALYVSKNVKDITPSRFGGTGISSESPSQPTDFPYYMESGTQNAPGLAGLSAGIEFVLAETIEKIHQKEKELTSYLIDKLEKHDNIIIYGPPKDVRRAPVVSFNIKDVDCAEVSTILDSAFNIATRPGLHCSPDAHTNLGTIDIGGTVRVSPGYFTTFEEIDTFINAVFEIADSY